MTQFANGYGNNIPGMSDARTTSEAGVLIQTFFQGDVMTDPMPVIASTAVDAGNTPTSILRPGLLLGKLDASGLYVAYDPDATDGSQEARGVLVTEVNMLDYTTGSASARLGMMVVTKGKLKSSLILNLDQQARNQLAARGFDFDDGKWAVARFSRVVEKAADYTVLAADNGKLFLATTGAVNFTLPAISAGLVFEFLNTVDANMTITSPTADNIIGDHDASLDSIAFSTSSHKIGGHVRVEAIYLGGVLKWMTSFLSNPANTVTQVS